MKRSLILTGLAVFAVLWCIIMLYKSDALFHDPIEGDPDDYRTAAMHLVEHGMYSLDGSSYFMEREPGYSVFLAVVYVLTGSQHRIVVYIAQALFYIIAVMFFISEIRRFLPRSTTTVLFFLLLIPAPIFHSLLSFYREGFALALCMIVTGLLCRSRREKRMMLHIATGAVFGFLILTYYQFIFFPIFLLLMYSLISIPFKRLMVIVLIAYAVVFLWAGRNYIHEDGFRVIGNFRSTFMWHVRGEQAEHVRGLEPFRCLWSEYISRDWSGRSEYCSYNAVWHRKWPDGVALGNESEIAAEGRQKILHYFPHYLWFSVFEVLEFHLPFMDGWGFAYNVSAAISMFILYLGCVFALPYLWKRDYRIILLFAVYTTAIYALADATPRYLIPTIFCYVFFAAVGYAVLLKHIIQSWKH